MAILRLTIAASLLLLSGNAASNDLHLVKEATLAELLVDFPRGERIEASGVYALNGIYYVVLDGHDKLLAIDDRSWTEAGVTRPELNKVAEDVVEAEGLGYDQSSERWLLVEEAIERAKDGDAQLLNARVHRFQLSADLDETSSKKPRWLPYNFQTKNKGIEGLAVTRRGDEQFLLALCEGNDCDGGDPSKQPGNGRIKVFETAGDNWSYVASIDLPDSVEFIDFSGLDLRGDRVAVTSQESSALWVGRLDPNKWQISGAGRIYVFPKSTSGEKTYCNVEGVSWIDDTTIVVVSDAKKDDDPRSCKNKEQSIHVFEILG